MCFNIIPADDDNVSLADNHNVAVDAVGYGDAYDDDNNAADTDNDAAAEDNDDMMKLLLMIMMLLLTMT